MNDTRSQYSVSSRKWVVTNTVTSNPVFGGNTTPICPATKKPRATANDTAIAAISLHALMRHQYHRSR